MYLRLAAGYSRMTEIAVLDRPCNVAVVAAAAVFAVDNLQHADIISSGLKLKPQIIMTDLATKADAVEPMWEDDRAHAGIFGVLVDHDVTVFPVCGAQKHHQD